MSLLALLSVFIHGGTGKDKLPIPRFSGATRLYRAITLPLICMGLLARL